MKRHGFKGKEAARRRTQAPLPGSIGGRSSNLGTGKPKKGIRMAGRMGDEQDRPQPPVVKIDTGAACRSRARARPQTGVFRPHLGPRLEAQRVRLVNAGQPPRLTRPMIEIPVYNLTGEQTGSVSVDEAKLGTEVRPPCLNRCSSGPTPTAAHQLADQVPGRRPRLDPKLYKGTGNALRGDKKANILRGGGRAFAKTKHSWDQACPKMRRRQPQRPAREAGGRRGQADEAVVATSRPRRPSAVLDA